jgi:hypothetical protein
MIKKIRSRKGQSLVEALVALSILMVGLMGILTLLSRSFFIERTTSDETKATYLASEGIEIAKSFIDHDVYLGLATNNAAGGWGTCFNFTPGTPGAPTSFSYELDYTTVNCPASPNFAGDPLMFDPATGLYSYAGPYVGTPVKTTFVRTITIIKPSPYEIDVQSTVTWSSGSITNQSLTLEDHFYDWHP